MNKHQLEELIIQSLEHELSGVNVYTTALKCVLNPDLRRAWENDLDETRLHVQRLVAVCKALGFDASRQTAGRAVVRHLGGALVEAMKLALENSEPANAELVACECVVLAEAKDHFDWTLLSNCAEELTGEGAELFREACGITEYEQDEHVYHSKGWCRELWIQALGMEAVLPPPEERIYTYSPDAAAKAGQLLR